MRPVCYASPKGDGLTLHWLLLGSYLELLEVVAVPGPVDLREEVVVEDLAEQLEEVDLHLVEALVLQQLVQLGLPLLVVQRRQELADQRRHLPTTTARAAAAGVAAAAGGTAELEVLKGIGTL